MVQANLVFGEAQKRQYRTRYRIDSKHGIDPSLLAFLCLNPLSESLRTEADGNGNGNGNATKQQV